MFRDSVVITSAKNMMRKKMFLDSSFRAHLGILAKVCAQVWNLISKNYLNVIEPKTLLYGLKFLTVISNEANHCLPCDMTRNSFRKCSWIPIKLMASLQVVTITFSPRNINSLVFLNFYWLTYAFQSSNGKKKN